MRERKKPDYGFGFCRKCGAQYKRGGATAKYCAPCAKSTSRAYYAAQLCGANHEEISAQRRVYTALRTARRLLRTMRRTMLRTARRLLHGISRTGLRTARSLRRRSAQEDKLPGC